MACWADASKPWAVAQQFLLSDYLGSLLICALSSWISHTPGHLFFLGRRTVARWGCCFILLGRLIGPSAAAIKFLMGPNGAATGLYLVGPNTWAAATLILMLKIVVMPR
ncbi:hypothetical protein Salat_2724900 [Sesamum alatum]|uniref:Uncharacterized protein n=1 Tax=Sesamum alatum TaxID=300844 RepID=A0AAE1XQH1_9LAMI|nr:hypothetical protein Salat_2724900 [Sesamum alatum]